jgi:uncharacterized membrane protein HdeD (DUF308 family)
MLIVMLYQNVMVNDTTSLQTTDSSTGTFLLGAVLIVLGILTIAARVFVAVTSIYLFGIVLLVTGVVQLIQAFLRRSLNDFLLYLFFGILSIIVGFIILANPTASLLSVTMLLSVFFFVGGLFQILSSVLNRFPHWGSGALAGVFNVIIGWMVFANWPLSGFTALGWLLGLGLAVNGLAIVISSFAKPAPLPKQAPRMRESISYSQINKGGDKNE